MARIITVTSGKGGVGKTNISVNLSLYLAGQGYRTCLFDADMGLANTNILLGLYPEYSLEDVIFNKKSIDDILIRGYHGIDIIPGSSGVQKMADLNSDEVDNLIRSLSELKDYDFFLFDTSAGVSKNVVSFCMASSEIILVVTTEPTSLTDAYSLLKILSLNGFNDPVMVVVNQCKNIQVANNVFTKFKTAVQKFLPIKILPLGTIIQDPHVVEAVKDQKPFIWRSPNSHASKCIKNIARHLIMKDAEEIDTRGINAFWTRCLKLFESPLQLTASKKVEVKTAPEEKEQAPQPDNEKPLSQNKTMRSSSKEQERSPINIEKEGLSENIPLLLQSLVQGISSISQELVAIRKVIEGGRRRSG